MSDAEKTKRAAEQFNRLDEPRNYVRLTVRGKKIGDISEKFVNKKERLCLTLSDVEKKEALDRV